MSESFFFPTLPLLQWYDQHGRPLPWRASTEPYSVLVSEIMLHQTQVTTVIPYYQRFMASYPSVHALASADMQDVAPLWKGLGYYRRLRNLHATAVLLAKRLDSGEGWPCSFDIWHSFPGIGAYTAAVLASITSGQAVPALDANVLRVMARYVASEQSIARATVQRSFRELLQKAIALERPGDFNQALMELGECICTPKRTECTMCPLAEGCQGYRQGIQLQLPIRAVMKEPRSLDYRVYVLCSAQGVAVETRQERMLQHQWQFPMLLHANDAAMPASGHSAQEVLATINQRCSFSSPSWVLDYRYTHQIWRMQPCVVHLDTSEDCDMIRALTSAYMWHSVDVLMLPRAPLIRAHQKVLERLCAEDWL